LTLFADRRGKLFFTSWVVVRLTGVTDSRVLMQSTQANLLPLDKVLATLLSCEEARSVESQLRALFPRRNLLAYASDVSLDDCLEDKRAIVLLMTPRSGSTYLSQLVGSTRQLGLLGEYMNWADAAVGRFLNLHPAATLPEYMRCLARIYSNDTGVFSMKGDLYQCLPLIRTGLIRGGTRKTHFVYLTREDLLAQAISLFRAVQTGQWSSAHSPVAPARFDARGILQQLEYLATMMARWELVFSLFNIQPVRMTYEQLIADPASTVQRLASLVGVRVTAGVLQSELRQQRDALSAEWQRRLRSEAEQCLARLFNRSTEAAATGQARRKAWSFRLKKWLPAQGTRGKVLAVEPITPG
jgi:trehalose 2-sulfotransferase